MKFISTDGILDFAIGKEEEAAALYRDLAEKAVSPGLKNSLLEFAAEEDRHKQRLLAIKAGDLEPLSVERVRSLYISDYMVDVAPSTEMSYAQALQLAMKAEQAAYQLYSDLAGACEDPGLAALFTALAREEQRHKALFEREYEDQRLEGV